MSAATDVVTTDVYNSDPNHHLLTNATSAKNAKTISKYENLLR